MERRDRGRFIRGLVGSRRFLLYQSCFPYGLSVFRFRYDPSIQPEDSLAFTEYIIFPGSVDV